MMWNDGLLIIYPNCDEVNENIFSLLSYGRSKIRLKVSALYHSFNRTLKAAIWVSLERELKASLSKPITALQLQISLVISLLSLPHFFFPAKKEKKAKQIRTVAANQCVPAGLALWSYRKQMRHPSAWQHRWFRLPAHIGCMDSTVQGKHQHDCKQRQIILSLRNPQSGENTACNYLKSLLKCLRFLALHQSYTKPW